MEDIITGIITSIVGLIGGFGFLVLVWLAYIVARWLRQRLKRDEH